MIFGGYPFPLFLSRHILRGHGLVFYLSASLSKLRQRDLDLEAVDETCGGRLHQASQPQQPHAVMLPQIRIPSEARHSPELESTVGFIQK